MERSLIPKKIPGLSTWDSELTQTRYKKGVGTLKRVHLVHAGPDVQCADEEQEQQEEEA